MPRNDFSLLNASVLSFEKVVSIHLGVNPLEWFNCPERIAFCATVPERIRVLLEPFTDHQWNLLDLFSKNERETRALMISSKETYQHVNAWLVKFMSKQIAENKARMRQHEYAIARIAQGDIIVKDRKLSIHSLSAGLGWLPSVPMAILPTYTLPDCPVFLCASA